MTIGKQAVVTYVLILKVDSQNMLSLSNLTASRERQCWIVQNIHRPDDAFEECLSLFRRALLRSIRFQQDNPDRKLLQPSRLYRIQPTHVVQEERLSVGS